jgi:murein DD-endopeptidase
MTSLVSLAKQTAFALQIGLLFLTPCLARERGPRVAVECPSPPIPVTIDRNRALVYELHVTNFDTVALTLTRVEVFPNEESEQPLLALETEKLSAAMVRIGAGAMKPDGSNHGDQDVRIIFPGGRNVVFMWIELPENRPVPATLKHRFIFSSTPAGGSHPSDIALESFPVSVSQSSVPTLSPPLDGGTWLAGDGPSNSSGHRRTIVAIDGHIYSPERFAIDWVKIGPNEDTHHDGKTQNANWWGWGEPVLAVSDGEITEAVDEFADNTPGVLPPVTLDNIAGNHIILRIGPDRFVTYAHLQKGSIKVRPGDHVHRGDVLALLGNSGNTTGAHLHMQVTDRGSVLQSQGVPFVFASFVYLGPGADYPEKRMSAPWLNSMPPGNGVVKFKETTK